MRRCFFIAGLTAAAASSQAAGLSIDQIVPLVSSDVLKIEGAGFGQGPTVAVYQAFESEEAAEGKTISGEMAQIGKLQPHEYYPATYSSEGRSGSFSGKLYDGAQSTGMRQLQSHFPASSEVFISYWVRIVGEQYFPGREVTEPRTFSGDSSWKMSWLIDQDYQGKSSDVCLPTHTGGGNFMMAGNDFNLVTGLGNEWWSWDNWMQLSFWLKAAPHPTDPGTVVFETRSSDNGYKRRVYEKPVFDEDGLAEKVYRQANFPGWIRNAKGDGTDVLYDDIYVAYGPGAVARVEIGDSATYSESNNTYILPVETWTDTEITAALPEFLQESVQGAYLYVTDSEGNTNEDGIKLPVRPTPITEFASE